MSASHTRARILVATVACKGFWQHGVEDAWDDERRASSAPKACAAPRVWKAPRMRSSDKADRYVHEGCYKPVEERRGRDDGLCSFASTKGPVRSRFGLLGDGRFRGAAA
jgi:hypothetical protein